MNACSWRAPMVTLYSGEQVPSDSQAWMAECEARYVLQLDLPRRAEFLALVAQRRGQEAGHALKMRCYEFEPHYLLAMSSKAQRQAYLAAVEARFGRNPTDTLKAKILALHAARQPVAEPVQQSA